LERGDVEAALASARQALDLDPDCEAAKTIEAQALQRLDEEVGAAAPAPDASLPPRQTLTLADLAPTVIARRTPVPSAPAKPVPAPDVSKIVTPHTLRSGAFLAETKRSLQELLARVTALLKSTRAAINVRSKQQKMAVVGGVAAVVLMVVVGVAIMTVPGPTPIGTVVIDAVPWAQIVDIQAEDGTHPPLPADASTPLRIALPAGPYRIRVVGPPPRNETRDIRVQVTANATFTSQPQRFDAITAEEYFTQYFQAPASSLETGSAASTVEPTTIAPASQPPTSPASAPFDSRGTRP
jgi:hypothetical protein